MPVGYRRVIVAGSVGTFIELYDLVVYGYFAAVLAERFFPGEDPTAALLATFAIFAVGFFVRPLGAVIFGHLGDRFGRRPALAASLLLMTAATVAFGLLPTYATVGVLAPALLLVCRLLQGLSASAEIPGAQLLIMEHVPEGRRGRAVSINNAAGQLAAAAAAAVGLTLTRVLTPEQLGDWGWRVAFLLAAPIGLVGLYVRLRLLDTPAFLALGEMARRGSAPLARALRTSKRGMLAFLIWTAVVALGVYVVVGYLPSYLTQTAGLSRSDALTANLVAVVTLAGSSLLGGYLVDRVPLRRVAIGVMTGVCVAAVPGLLIVNEYRNLVSALLGQSLWTIFLGAGYTVATMMSLRLFPAAIRFSATAVALNLGVALFGSTAPYVCTWLVATTANPVAPGFYLFAAAIGGLLTTLLLLSRHDLDPEAAAAPERAHRSVRADP
jgi:MHS family proline/betaine transporter-like MFS transporter